MPIALDQESAPNRVVFVRHGATAANLEGVRCGGDLDIPLAEAGRIQARTVAKRLTGMAPRIGVIVTSDLQRTRETAEIIAGMFDGVCIVVEPAFRERMLGRWNRMPIEATERWLRERLTPPGGEADADFIARIGGALAGLIPLLPQRPLLVASRGVGRALGELLQVPGHARMDNGEVAEFDLARLAVVPNSQPLTECPV